MTLKQFMETKGWARPGSNKVVCPFHGDRNPSAYLNLNSIFCFSENRLYSLWDFQQAFDVVLDKEADGKSDILARLKGEVRYSYNDVLFTADFQVNDGRG
jgi:hypothetical protein